MTTRQAARRIGILAGGGRLPGELAASLKTRGVEPVVLAIEGEADAHLSEFHAVPWKWGQVGRLLRELKRQGCRELVIIGSVTRPDLGRLHPDLGFFRAIPTIWRLVRVGGDDAILRAIVGFFEQKGIAIVGPATLAPEMLIGEGSFGAVPVPQSLNDDIARGFALVSALAPYDVGQAVVVADGRIEAIEGSEGTDRMLERVARARRIGQRGGDARTHGVFVKRPKPGQEMRVDLPVIGPQTINGVLEANLAGVAVEARCVLAVERRELRDRADRHELFVAGFVSNELRSPVPARNGEDYRAERRGRRRMTRTQATDAIKGAQVADVMEPFGVGDVVIVTRGHVLAVAAAESIDETISRSAHLRQWGDRRWARKSGVAVLAAGRDAEPGFVNAVADSGLAGIGIRLSKFAAPVRQQIVEQADKRGLFIAALAPGH